MNLRNQFRVSPFEKVCSPCQNSGNRDIFQGYHAHLTSSLQAFQNKQWLPLTHNELKTTVTRCRPLSGNWKRRRKSHSDPRSSRCYSAASHRPVRPSTANSQRSMTCEASEVNQGNFDALTPSILSNLIDPGKSILSFGDNFEKGEGIPDNDNASCTDKTASDLDDDDDTSREMDVLFGSKQPESKNILIRLEKLDAIYVPVDKKDPKQFDFDAENSEIPPYEFINPIPEPFNKLDLKLIAKHSYEWREIIKTKPKEILLEKFLDRIIEIEKNQLETEEWEIKRLKQIRRIHESSAKAHDGKCCSTCVQPACVGDCPEKKIRSNVCTLCRQPLCEGSCQETSYDDHMRHDREEEIKLYLKPPTQICQTCQAKHNAKLINANNLIMGRPRSGFATYSRGQNSAKPKDLRPKSVNNLDPAVIKEFEKLGVAPSPMPPAKPSSPSSRNLLIPGKTYLSNRKKSLTDTECTKRQKSKLLRLK